MSLDLVVGQELEWSQPKAMRRFFTLMNGPSEIASLRFESRSLATGEYNGGTWTFKRTGFLSPKITVRPGGSDGDCAVFTPGWTGSGTVAFATGPRYHLRPSNFWRTEWTFEAEDGRVLATLSGRPHLFKQGGIATLTEVAANLAEAPVLLLLMWYVRVLIHEEEATGAVVVACG